MGTVRTRRWDAAEHLEDEADIVAYLDAILEEGDAQLVAAALGDVVRSRGMARIARESGLAREGLYRSLSSQGNPELATILKVIEALGLRFTVQPRRVQEHAQA